MLTFGALVPNDRLHNTKIMDWFYQPGENSTILSGPEAVHCVKVLRLGKGDRVVLTDGRGGLRKARIVKADMSGVEYVVEEQSEIARRPYRIHMVIAPTRKPERNEWMMEKLCEVGVDKVTFVCTENTHRESFSRVVNRDRMEKIAIAAMKQSQQVFKTEIAILSQFRELFRNCEEPGRYIAYVDTRLEVPHLLNAVDTTDSIVLIGPEGDFSPEEVTFAFSQGFKSVSLGVTRLRTETAALMACQSVHLSYVKHAGQN